MPAVHLVFWNMTMHTQCASRRCCVRTNSSMAGVRPVHSCRLAAVLLHRPTLVPTIQQSLKCIAELPLLSCCCCCRCCRRAQRAALPHAGLPAHPQGGLLGGAQERDPLPHQRRGAPCGGARQQSAGTAAGCSRHSSTPQAQHAVTAAGCSSTAWTCNVVHGVVPAPISTTTIKL